MISGARARYAGRARATREGGCLLTRRIRATREGMVRRSARYWTAAVTRFCEETRAAHHVERQGFQYILPYVEVRGARGWRRELMFPGYILVRLADGWESLSSTRGISRLLMTDGVPHHVPKSFVSWMLSASDSRGVVALTPPAAVGDRVVAYNGFRGTVREVLSQDRIVRCRVLMELMGRSVESVFDARELRVA